MNCIKALKLKCKSMQTDNFMSQTLQQLLKENVDWRILKSSFWTIWTNLSLPQKHLQQKGSQTNIHNANYDAYFSIKIAEDTRTLAKLSTLCLIQVQSSSNKEVRYKQTFQEQFKRNAEKKTKAVDVIHVPLYRTRELI